jgi:hypothetical protein
MCSVTNKTPNPHCGDFPGVYFYHLCPIPSIEEAGNLLESISMGTDKMKTK